MIPLPTVPGGFGCLVADPAWQFTNKATRAAAEDHYPTMDFYEICGLRPQRVMAPNSHLYLWTTDSHLEQALGVMEAWGFVFKQTLVWVKVSEKGALQIGLGNYYRHAHEICLFGVRGRAPAVVKNLPSVFWAPRGKHSAKPDAIYQMAEQLSPGPYLEMFARTSRPNWAAWGNEAPETLLDLEMRALANPLQNPGGPSPTGRFAPMPERIERLAGTYESDAIALVNDDDPGIGDPYSGSPVAGPDIDERDLDTPGLD